MKTTATSVRCFLHRITVFIALITIVHVSFSQEPYESKGSWNCYQGKIHRKNVINDKSLNSPAHSFDVINYTLNLDLYNCYFSPYPKSFQASEIITFRVDTALNTINLNAENTSIVVDSVSMSGISFTHLNNILTITLNQTYSPGAIVDVKIYYHHLNVSDNAFYTGNGFAFTDCEPEGARHWFPCWDKPSDKAMLDLTAKVPDNVLFASNGRLQDSTHISNYIIYHWISSDPIATYLMVMTSKLGYNLDVLYWPKISNPNIMVPIRYYYNTGENPAPSKNVILDMTTYFSNIFCEHPFEKNGFCSLDNQFPWGGMENQTLTSLCDGCWGVSLTAHEYAHQWFGDMITCGTWADIFLNEGFATYSEALWWEHANSYALYKADIDDYADYYLNHNPGWPIYNPSWAVSTPNMSTLFNYAVTYCKGACVLHMFRYTVGDSLFFASLKQYASDTVNFKYKNSMVTDFKTKINQVCAQNMDWFWNEWLNEPNHPVYANTYSFYNNGNGTWTVNFLATQVQTNPSFFKMPLELHIDFNDGTDTTVTVMNDQNNQLFQIIFNKQPTALTFDPDNNIVLKESTTIVDVSEMNNTLSAVVMYQNNPNPTSNITHIAFELPFDSPVKISVYDVFGKLVSTELDKKMNAGKHEIEFNVSGLPNGIYFYSLEAAGIRLVNKMVVM